MKILTSKRSILVGIQQSIIFMWVGQLPAWASVAAPNRTSEARTEREARME